MTANINEDIHSTYRQIADKYDLFSKLPLLTDFREKTFRRKAVTKLHISPGDTAVEIG